MSSRRLCVHPVTVYTQRWASCVQRVRSLPWADSSPSFTVNLWEQIHSEGEWECSRSWDLVVDKTAMVYHLMELTQKLFCFKMLYIKKYLWFGQMTTVYHPLNLSYMAWIHKNLILKLLDSQEERTLALSDKSWKEIILKRPSSF